MSTSVSSARRRAAHVMHAKHGIAATVAGRKVADERLNARLIERWQLDPEAGDFAQRLRSARRAHFSDLRKQR